MSRQPDQPEREIFCGYCGERLPHLEDGQGGNCPECKRRFRVGTKMKITRPPPLPPAWDFDFMWRRRGSWDPRFKDPVLAALLSAVIPGSGQVYNFQFFKGLLVFLSCWLVIPYFLGIFDAYMSAERLNRCWQAVTVPRQ